MMIQAKTNDPIEGRVGDWQKTYTGRRIFPLDPRPDEISITDICHSLSMQCRFNGHCRNFYSVAEHSFLVSQEVKRRGGTTETQLIALLHDAPEAYLGDMVKPLKDCGAFPAFKEYEDQLLDCILRALGVTLPGEAEWDDVKQVDCELLFLEAEQLLGGTDGWGNRPSIDPTFRRMIGGKLKCLDPATAKVIFMTRWSELRKEKERFGGD